jgi:hypothetical protein
MTTQISQQVSRMEYWRQLTTDYIWAVHTVEGRVVEVSGPIDPHDMLSDMLPFLPYRRSDAQWFEARKADFCVLNSMSEVLGESGD